MKQLWFGIGLLVLLLVGGIFSSFFIQQTQSPISAQLDRAADAGFLEKWEEAQQRFSSAQTRWEKHKKVLAAIADHGPMEEIDCLFEELEFYIRAEESAMFAGLCSRLSQLFRSLAESNLLSWWNLL